MHNAKSRRDLILITPHEMRGVGVDEINNHEVVE